MAKPTAQACHAMTSYYIGRYTETRGHAPIVNRNKARYTFEGLLMDYTSTEVKQIIDYFIEHYERDLEWFNYNYEKVVKARQEALAEKFAQAKRRADTALAMERWKKKREELDAARRGRTD
jgi:hypothetical protein